ncbi:MAG: DUF3379 family protein [Xanthomonadales bacterium]|nr:DUF3379 family protein [Xanthomonadales bacterium]
MNFSDFKLTLGADPRSKDPDFLRARLADPELRVAAEEALAFEDKLDAALAVDVPSDLLDRISAIPSEAPQVEPQRQNRWAWLAAAAVVVAGVGFASYTWYESTFYWENVDDYIVEHWADDGNEFLQQADGQPDPNAEALFARFDVEISSELAARIDFIHACRTPGSRGAHMIITTENGPVTLIFMPEVDTDNGHILAMSDQVAATLPLERGSAVIIGPSEETITPIYLMARAGIRPVATTS